MMKTTLNIHIDVMKKITFAAQKQGISHSEMIVMLLNKSMDEMQNRDRIGRLVQYQQRDSPDKWHPFHIRWKWDEYEFFQDMRKLLKMSVSLILAYAVEKFLDKVMKKNKSDNNHFHNYILAKEVIDGIIIWKLIWGFPPNLEKYIAFHSNT
jgi:hypothetical protein